MEEQESFTVRDKRRFREGAEGGGTEAAGGTEGAEEPKEEIKHEEREAGQREQKQSYTHAAEINFASFIFSLGRSAFVHLGEEPDPVSGEKKVSLDMAKETIDIITLLEEKTRGNLTQDEEQLLKNILYALRMKYVEMAAKKPNP